MQGIEYENQRENLDILTLCPSNTQTAMIDHTKPNSSMKLGTISSSDCVKHCLAKLGGSYTITGGYWLHEVQRVITVFVNKYVPWLMQEDFRKCYPLPKKDL